MEDFDRLAHNYKAVLDKSLEVGGEKGEYFAHYKADYLKRYLGPGFSGKILDYGCGIGLLSELLIQYFPQATVDGYDVSAASIDHVPGHLKKQGVFTSLMDHLAGGYDLAVIVNVLHHIEPHERAGAIQKLKNLVKPGGVIIIFEHNPFNPLTRKVVNESPIDKGVVLLPCWEVLRYLKQARFAALKLKFILFFPKLLAALRWAEPHLSWLPIGAQYVVIGEVTHAKT